MKQAILSVYRRLPFPIAVAVARNRPNLAFYLKCSRRTVIVPDYLGLYRVEVDTGLDIERRMLSRSYEPAAQAVIARLVRPGDRCVDVGANVGALALAMARAAGPSGRVDAFEPGPPIFARFAANLARNPQLTSIHAHRMGLADRDGELLWQESLTDPGNASIHWADPSRPSTPVPVTTLDRLAAPGGELALDSLRLLKIDVEGMELPVIRGGLETITRHRPAIFYESTLADDEQRRDSVEIEAILRPLGYRFYKVDHRGGTVETRYPDYTLETLALPEGFA